MKTILSVTLLASFIISPAFACTPIEGEHYDELPDQNILIGIADVISIAISAEAGETCLSAAYATKESILGQMPDGFEVSSCVAEIPMVEAIEDELMSEFGFITGATVMIGVIQTETSNTGWRYAVPTCWGPFHVRMDTLSDDDRSNFISSIRSEIESHAPD